MIALLALGISAQAQNAFADLVSTHALTAADDYRIGSNYVQLSGWLYGQVEDPAVVRRVEGITRRVLAASDRPQMVVNVIVVDSAEVNASAYPGGFLVVNRGAVELFDDEELLFVLDHEISHVLLRHYATTENLRVATQALSVAESAVQIEDRPRAEAAAMEIQQMMARYGRQLEFEADLYGMLYTARAGVPAEAAIRAMNKLHEAVGPVPEELKDIADHPTFEERVAELKSGRESMIKSHRRFDVGVSALSAGLGEMAVESFQEFLTLFPRSSAGWTNLAAAHLQVGLAESSDPWLDRVPIRIRNDVTLRSGGSIHMDRARSACSKALGIDPNTPECLVMLGVMARHAGKLDEAATLYERADSLSKEPDPSLWVDRGILLAMAGKNKAATALWDKVLEHDPHAVYARANKAVLAEQSGDEDAALVLWQGLLSEGVLPGRAGQAVARLGPEPTPAKRTEAKLGKLALGMEPSEVQELLGDASVREGDEIGLNQYWMWPDKGISVLFSADAAVGMECWNPCSMELSGVEVGQPFNKALAQIGRPYDLVADPLFGLNRTAHIDRMGVTLYEMSGVVGRIAVWEP